MAAYPYFAMWPALPMAGYPYHTGAWRLHPVPTGKYVSTAAWLPFFAHPYMAWARRCRALYTWHGRPCLDDQFLGVAAIPYKKE